MFVEELFKSLSSSECGMKVYNEVTFIVKKYLGWKLGFLLFGLQVVPVDPSLIPSDDPRHEGWIIQGSLTEILTDLGMEFLLIRDMQPGHKTLQQCACSN